MQPPPLGGPTSGMPVAGGHTAGPLPAQTPALSLPKGGGAIRGIGEKFAANPVTGTGSLTVPIFASPGRSGFGPQLSLTYDSGAGNGPFGLGWSLALPSITRKTDKGLPQYVDMQESDTFILSGAEDLVPVLVRDHATGLWAHEALLPRTVYHQQYRIHRYRPRVEGLFARIERWVNLADPSDTFWRSISKDNITSWYGTTAKSRIYDPADPTRVFSWLLCESYDDTGNVIAFGYKADNSDGVDRSLAHERNRTEATRSVNRYPKWVWYGNRTPYFPDLALVEPVPLPTDWCFELVFDYGEHDDLAPLPGDDGTPWTCRPDPFSSYRAGFEVRTYRLCRRALMFHHFDGEPGVGRDCLVRSTDFTHAQPAQPAQPPQTPPDPTVPTGATHPTDPPDPSKPFYSLLLSVTQTGYRRSTDGGYLAKALPPLEFAYTEAVIDETVREVDPESLENLPQGLDGRAYQWVDLDGEGLSGILTEQAGGWFYKPNLSPVLPPDDDDGDDGGQTRRARFGPLQQVATRPSLAALGSGRQQLLDLAGDGQLDLVEFAGPTPGFFERTTGVDGDADAKGGEDGRMRGGWAPFTPFASLPVLDWANPNLKFVDLTGDGHADLLISEDGAFCWHPSLAEAGFSSGQRVPQSLDEEQGPKLLLADGTESVFLADVSGDGLTDLVRVRNGEVCYWPNLGYGRFGPKVTMDGAPWFEAPDLFDSRRLRLADIDGSGTADIVYCASGGVHLYFNQSGNAWGARRALGSFPPVESVSSAVALDLLGNGTACLLWSSPLPGHARRPLRYIDLMGGQKPHLLVGVANNLGAETRIQYAPSTRFYVADKLAGTPWLTRIPFPVHIVERVEAYDYVSRNRFVTRYAYHHGYFDGVEREFRGFGRVDQWDTEELATLTAGGAFPQATDLVAATNLDAASHVPPVWTKTWFHTGAFVGAGRISKYLEHEYYREGDPSDAIAGLTEAQLEAMLLDDTVVPTRIHPAGGSPVPYALSGEEVREACRALRGSILRQEIYALDGTDAADRPYSTSECNYTIEVLQPQASNRHAVFFAHPRETLDFHYERTLVKVAGDTLVDPSAPPSNAHDAADPRVTHAITLAVDPFGNVLQSVAVGYGRRYQDPILTLPDQTKQTTTLSTHTENGYTSPVLDDDAYRTPLPAESSTYELLQVQPDGAQQGVTNLFRFDEVWKKVQAAGDGNHDILYEDVDWTGVVDSRPWRRLIARTRTLYRPNDLGAAAGDPMALLPPRTVESLALPGEQYTLAFTPGLLTQIYQRQRANQPPEYLLPYPTSVLGGAGSDQGGYVDLDGDGHWWVPSGRIFSSPGPGDASAQELAFARQHFFLPHRYRDPFGRSSTITYDAYALLLQETRDPLGNVVTVLTQDDQGNDLIALDYRVLQPWLVTDPNGNRAQVAFDALGMVAGTAVRGKLREALGDTLDAFTADLTQQQIDAFHDADDPHVVAGALLGTASTRILYDVERFHRTRIAAPDNPSQWELVFAATIARETHTSDLAPNQQTKLQISVSYSDGYGREVQKKIQAEPGPVADGGPAVHPRWVGSGWTIFNNKGKPVRQYEPFFSQLPTKGHRFEFGMQVGVSPILCYDPVERVVATIHPSHTYEKVVFDPWRQATWDVNDTVFRADPNADPDVGGFFQRLPGDDYLPSWYALRTDPPFAAQAAQRWPDPNTRAAEVDAATKAAAHAHTPAIAHLDTLGRMFLTISDNAADGKYQTRVALDIVGNQRSVTDALERIVMAYDYDMLGNRIHQMSMEAGGRWTLNDVAGKPIRAWDSRGHNFWTTYDALRRPTELAVQGTDAIASDPRTLSGKVLYQKITYGEGQPKDQALNLRTRVFRHYDAAGVVTSMGHNPATDQDEAYDFKGNLLRASRQLVADYKALPDWSGAGPVMPAEVFASSTQFDALNRPVASTTPDGSVVRPTYNEANLLERVDVNLRGAPAATPFVTNIDYNARGQRVLIACGKNVTTAYRYDPATFHLVRLTTTRQGFSTGEATIQDLSYTYDPAGNITRIRDDADIQNVVFFRNKRVEPSGDYTYDAIYRLVAASGREHLGQGAAGQPLPPAPTTYNDVPRVGLLQPGDGNAMGIYTEQYLYDAVGNFVQLVHRGSDPASPGWTRAYFYEETSPFAPAQVSNRLTRTVLNPGGAQPITEKYGHDRHGNIRLMPQLQVMDWDFTDQLLMTQRQAVNASDQNGVLHQGERTNYVYDAAGQRVRKVTERQNGTLKCERIYLGGYDVYREYDGLGTSVSLERQSLHVMDDKWRVALVETKTIDAGPLPGPVPSTTTRYQYDNHLGSACLEVDETAAVISYEEYYPYGSTSYQAGRSIAEVSLKRYRYTGKERDEETGFAYHGARYYAPWLGRWTGADPIGLKAGVNPYLYVRNNPLRLIDPGGTEDTPAEKKPGFFTMAGMVAHGTFTVMTGQTPEKFGRGMVDKAKSLTVDPVMRLWGPKGMLDKGAQKIVDKLQGIKKPDDAYVTKEEHEQYFRDITAVGGALFPGVGEVEVGVPGPAAKLATSSGEVVQAPVMVTVRVSNATVVKAVKAGVALNTAFGTGGGKSGKKAESPKKGPGEWEEDITAGTNMKPDQAKYQKQVTGRKPSKTYHVKRGSLDVSFDSWEPGARGKPGTLVEAKHLGDEGRFTKAYENMKQGNFSDWEHLEDRAENILEQAQRQVTAAEGTGARIEWRVSGEKAEQALKALFEHDPELKGKIDVVHIPKK